jgi:hypothetical protein
MATIKHRFKSRNHKMKSINYHSPCVLAGSRVFKPFVDFLQAAIHVLKPLTRAEKP